MESVLLSYKVLINADLDNGDNRVCLFPVIQCLFYFFFFFFFSRVECF